MTSTLAKSLVLAAVVLGTVLTASTAGAYDLRIGTRTRLDVRTSVEGTLVRVDGHLRDNVGQGISGEIVTIEFERKVNPTGVNAGDVRTDRTGRFYHSARLGTGTFLGRVHYAGREHYYAASEFELTVESKQGSVALGIETPRFLKEGSGVTVRVLATSTDRPVAELPVKVAIGGLSVDVETGKNGTAVATLSPESVRAGELPITASFAGNMDYAGAVATSSVRVLVRPAWTDYGVTQVRQRLRRGVRAGGRFADATGPIPGVPVDVVFAREGREVGRFSAKTGDDGTFDVFVAESNLQGGPHTVTARARVGAEQIDSKGLEVTVSKTGTGWVAWVLGGILGACLLVLLGFMARELVGDVRRRRPRKASRRPRQTLQQARAPRIVAMEEPPPADVGVRPDGAAIAGIISDAQTREPIAGARVALHDDDGEVVTELTADERGVFRFTGLPAGRLEIHARTKGYVSAAHRFTIPHAGSLAWFRFPMTPVRVVVRDLYEGLVEDLSTHESPWGRLTPRQTVRILLAAVRAPGGPASGAVPEGYQAFRERLAAVLASRQAGDRMTDDDVVSAVVEVLEEVYYSHRLHDEAVATIMERLTDDVRRRAEGP